VLLLSTPALHAQNANTSANTSFSVQGRLTDMNGTAVANGSHQVTINVYTVGGSNAVYTETDNVNTTDGVFTVMLGSNANQHLTINSGTNYELGISVDGGAELTPRLRIGSVPSAATAHVADTAGVALNVGANILTRLDSSLLQNVGQNIVTSINGMRGAVNIMGGGNLGVTTSGDTISLNFTGSGSGLSLPFSQTLNSGSGLLTLTNSGTGSAELLANTGTGSALQLNATGGSALTATTSGNLAALDISNTGGGVAINALSTLNSAINATTNSSANAALQVKNASGVATGQIIRAMSASGTVLDLTDQGLTLTAPQDSSSSLLKLQNLSASASGNLITAANSGGQNIFTLTGSGAATLTSNANTALTINGNATTAISATANNANGAILRLQNTATGAGATLISALNSTGNTLFTIGANGAATVQSSASGAGLTVSSTGGAAINATGSVANGAVLQIQNTSNATGSALISASDSTGKGVFTVAANGATTIRSTAQTALYDSTSASGGTAARLVGGLSLVGPVGSGTISAGSLTAVISNVYAKANSMIFLTVNSALSGLTPIRITSTGTGTFTVGLIGAVPLSSNLDFNYLIINQ